MTSSQSGGRRTGHWAGQRQGSSSAWHVCWVGGLCCKKGRAACSATGRPCSVQGRMGSLARNCWCCIPSLLMRGCLSVPSATGAPSLCMGCRTTMLASVASRHPQPGGPGSRNTVEHSGNSGGSGRVRIQQEPEVREWKLYLIQEYCAGGTWADLGQQHQQAPGAGGTPGIIRRHAVAAVATACNAAASVPLHCAALPNLQGRCAS